MKHLLFIFLLLPVFSFAQLTGNEKDSQIPNEAYHSVLVTNSGAVKVYDVALRNKVIEYVEEGETLYRNAKLTDLNTNRIDTSGVAIGNKLTIRELKFVRIGTPKLTDDEVMMIEFLGSTWIRKEDID